MLLSLQEPLAQECYALMNIHGYQPRSVVEYRRRAFIARENKIRVTFDHHIVGTESGFDIFDSALPQYPVQDTSLVVLEVNPWIKQTASSRERRRDRFFCKFASFCLTSSKAKPLSGP